MIELAFYSALLRFVQALVLAAPTILVSLFVAGIFRRLFGHDMTRHIFGGSGWKSLVQSWAIGMLLPGCSLGVIPISRELRRAGLTGGAVLAFALSQPLFDPLSVLYGLTLSKPLVIFAFAGCSLVLVMIVGSLWDWMYPDSVASEPATAPVQAGWPRLVSILLVILRESAGRTTAYIGIGLLGSALLAAVLPQGALQRTMNGGNSWAPVTMTCVAIPAYATPTIAMSQLGSMFQHANSAGAALMLLTFGAGLNLGLIAWIVAEFGWRKSMVWFVLLVVAALSMAYALDRPLHPHDVDQADHTHTFDIYCAPFHAGESQVRALTWQRIREGVNPLNLAPLSVLGVFVVAGAAIQLGDPKQKLEAWLESRERSRVESRFDVSVPAPLVGTAVLAGIVALSIVGCFAYYPSKAEIFEEIQIVKAEAITAALQGDPRRTDHYIAIWDKWTRRLEVGVFLREWRLSRYQHVKARILRDKLELLRHEVEDGDRAAAAEMMRQVNVAHNRFRTAFEKAVFDGQSPAIHADNSTGLLDRFIDCRIGLFSNVLVAPCRSISPVTGPAH